MTPVRRATLDGSEPDPDARIEMNANRSRISVRRLMAAVAVAAMTLALASGSRTVHLSCHLCHNRKWVTSRLVLGFPVSRHEAMETRFPAEPGHRHVWWGYARSTDSLLLGTAAAASSRRYVDGSAAPDGGN